MIHQGDYFIMIMCLAPVLTFFVSAGLLTFLKKTAVSIKE